MRVKNRKLTLLITASYLLVTTASALFHSYHAHHDDSPTGLTVSASHHDDHDCSVCRFLAQKPAPTVAIAPADSGALVQGVVPLSPVCPAAGVFAAWHSRAPPVFA